MTGWVRYYGEVDKSKYPWWAKLIGRVGLTISIILILLFLLIIFAIIYGVIS